MKKMLALILALVMCFSLVACGGDKKAEEKPAEESKAPAQSQGGLNSDEATKMTAVAEADKTVKYKDTVRVSVSGERVAMGYYGSTNAQASSWGGMTMEPLFKFDYVTGEAVPVIAKEAVDVNGDGKTWKVTIRDDVTFHHKGKYYADLKASDVAFTFNALLPNSEGRQAGAFVRTPTLVNSVESAEATGEYEVTIKLKSPIFDFENWNHGLYIMSEKGLKEFGWADGQDVYTGAYWYDIDNSTMGQKHIMRRYNEYWGSLDNYPTETIEIVVHTDVNTGVAALQAGEVDVLQSSAPEIAIQFQNNADYTVHKIAGQTTWFVGYNSYDGTGFFDNEDDPNQVKLRQAINYALDRDKIVSVLFAIMPDAGVRVDSIFGKSTPGYVDCGEWEFSVEKGRALMEEIGYGPNNRLSLVLAHIPRYTAYAQCVQDLLKEIYIDCELRNIEGSQYGSFLRTGKDWDLFCNYYTTGVTMLSVVSSHIASSGAGSKTQGWASAVADEKIAEVMNQPTYEAQKEAFGEFQKWVHDYHSRIPTHADMNMLIAKAEVEGVAVAPDIAYVSWSTLRIPE